MKDIDFVTSFIDGLDYKQSFVHEISKKDVNKITSLKTDLYIESPITYDIGNYFLLGFVTNNTKKLCFLISQDNCIHFVDLYINETLYKNSVFVVGIPQEKTYVVYDILIINGYNCNRETLLDKFQIFKHIFDKHCEKQLLNSIDLKETCYDNQYYRWSKYNNAVFYLTPLFFNHMVSEMPKDWFYNVTGFLWVSMNENFEDKIKWSFLSEGFDFFILKGEQVCDISVSDNDGDCFIKTLSQFRDLSTYKYKMYIYHKNKPLVFFSYIDEQTEFYTPVIANCCWNKFEQKWNLNYFKKGFDHETKHMSLLRLKNVVNISDLKKNY